MILPRRKMFSVIVGVVAAPALRMFPIPPDPEPTVSDRVLYWRNYSASYTDPMAYDPPRVPRPGDTVILRRKAFHTAHPIKVPSNTVIVGVTFKTEWSWVGEILSVEGDNVIVMDCVFMGDPRWGRSNVTAMTCRNAV